MQVILLERIEKLGQMGDVVTVRDGFARNYLLPQGKAMRATKQNRAEFDKRRAQLEARNLERKAEAEAAVGRIDGRSVVIIRQAGEGGQLYGSVNARDIAQALTDEGVSVHRNQVRLGATIKSLGVHPVRIALHPEVEAQVSVNVARSAEEAETQARPERQSAPESEDRAAALPPEFEAEEPAPPAL